MVINHLLIGMIGLYTVAILSIYGITRNKAIPPRTPWPARPFPPSSFTVSRSMALYFLLVKKLLKVWKADRFFVQQTYIQSTFFGILPLEPLGLENPSPTQLCCLCQSLWGFPTLTDWVFFWTAHPNYSAGWQSFPFLVLWMFWCVALLKAFGSSSGNFFFEICIVVANFSIPCLIFQFFSFICNVFREWYELHTHTHHTHIYLYVYIYIHMYIVYTWSYYIYPLIIYSKSLGQLFLVWGALSFVDSGGALCLSHWCDLLLGFDSVQPGWEETGWKPKGPLKDSKVLWFQWFFFDVFFLFIFFPPFGTPLLLGGFLVSFVSMKLFVEQLKLAGKWRSLRCNKVVMRRVFDELLEWNVWSPGVQENSLKRLVQKRLVQLFWLEATPSLQRKEGQALSTRFMLVGVFMRVQTCWILKTLPVPLVVGIPSKLWWNKTWMLSVHPSFLHFFVQSAAFWLNQHDNGTTTIWSCTSY